MNNPKTKISTKCSTTSGSSNARKGRQSVKTRRSCSKARPNPSTNRTAIRIDGHIKARSLPSEDDPYSGTIKTSKCSYHFLSLSSSWLTLPSVMSRMYNKTLLFSLSKQRISLMQLPMILSCLVRLLFTSFSSLSYKMMPCFFSRMYTRRPAIWSFSYSLHFCVSAVRCLVRSMSLFSSKFSASHQCCCRSIRFNSISFLLSRSLYFSMPFMCFAH